MNQQNTKARTSAPLNWGSVLMRTAGVLLCLVLFSVHLMGGLYARYISNGTAEDEARVAKFDVNVVGAADAAAVTCIQNSGDSMSYTITITNKSEVTVAYTITPTLTAATPIPGVSLSMDQSTGTLAAGNNTDTRTMTMNVDWEAFTAGATGASASATVSFTVTVHVEQVD